MKYHIPYRPVWEGGRYDGDESKRQYALRLASEFGADYIDIELKVVIANFSFFFYFAFIFYVICVFCAKPLW